MPDQLLTEAERAEIWARAAERRAGGHPLRRARLECGLTQSELAKLSGVPQQTIWHIEHRRTIKPSWLTIARLAKTLKRDPHELSPIDGDDDAADGDPRRQRS